MTRRRATEHRQTPLDWAVEGLTAATLVFLPLAYGTTQPWSQEIFFALVAAMGLCTLLRPLVHRGPALTWTWAYLPIVLFVALVVAQRVPLPRGLLGAISPHTLALKDELLVDLGAPAKTPLTFYALATDRQLRLVLAVATVFAVVVQTFRTPERRRRLLVSAAVAGMAVALVAAYGDLTHAETIYGSVPVGHANSGPFQNYSHFSQFMNLSVGAALAWLLVSLAEWSNGWRDARLAREQAQMAENSFVWPAAALVLGGPLLVFASMSRMGMISMLVSGAITAALLGWRGRPSGGRRRRSRHGGGSRRGGSLFLVVSFAVAVVAVLSAFGFDWVFDRLATLQTRQAMSVNVRQTLIRDLVPLWKQFPLLGTGLGTHEFVYPLFSHQDVTSLFTHAENEYAQLMEETGGLGVGLAVAFLAVVATAFVRTIRSPQRPEQYAAFGLGFGLIAVLIHSSSDFGQHVPADATLTAVLSGLLVRLGMTTRVAAAIATQSPSTPAPAGPGPLRLGPAPAGAGVGTRPTVINVIVCAFLSAALVVFASSFAWLILGADADRRAAAHFADAQDAGTDLMAGRTGDDEFRRLTTAAAAARDTLPADVVYAHWAAVARWKALSQAAFDPASGQLLFTPEKLETVRSIVADLDAARMRCPTFGPPLGLAGQLRARVLNDPAGDEQIRTAYRLTPHDRELCRMAGMLAVQRKRWDEATAVLGRYVRLGGPVWQVVDAFLLANRPDLAQSAAAGDWQNLRRLAAGLAAGWPKEQARAAECRQAGERLLVQASEAHDASSDTLAERARFEDENGHAGNAVLWYQKAVDAAYDRPDWHLALAKALVACGRADDAVHELRICLRQRRNWGEAQGLLDRVLRGVADKTARG